MFLYPQGEDLRTENEQEAMRPFFLELRGYSRHDDFHGPINTSAFMGSFLQKMLLKTVLHD